MVRPRRPRFGAGTSPSGGSSPAVFAVAAPTPAPPTAVSPGSSAGAGAPGSLMGGDSVGRLVVRFVSR